MASKTCSYTTRKMPAEYLKRMRMIAAFKSAETDHRVTMEWVLNEALKRGLPLIERDVFGDTRKGDK